MCLDELADFEVKRDWGRQCFFIRDDGSARQRYLHDYTLKWFPTPVIYDEWQTDSHHYRIRDKTSYLTGFHISLSKAGASYHLCGSPSNKVYFRNVVAKGYQTSHESGRLRKYKTIVARERYVCDKTDRPPKD